MSSSPHTRPTSPTLTYVTDPQHPQVVPYWRAQAGRWVGFGASPVDAMADLARVLHEALTKAEPIKEDTDA